MQKTTSNRTTPKGIILLFLTALIWGTSFVAQEVGSKSLGPLTFIGIRTILGLIVVFPFLLIRDRGFKFDRKLIKSGVILGVVFCFAETLQQFAFNYSTSGRIAFVTAFYIFIVPIIGLFTGKRYSILTWVSLAMGIAGLFLIVINPEDLGAVNPGDFITLACAVFFAIQIVLIDKYTGEGVDGVRLSFMQLLVASLILLVAMFIVEKPSLGSVMSAVPSLAYSGVVSCGIAYTLQIAGQKNCAPVIASLIMCLESVFAVIAAALLLGQTMSLREGIGCAVMFAAIALSQFANRK